MALPTPFRRGFSLMQAYDTLYTVPAGKYLEVTLIQAVNVDGGVAVDVSVGMSGASIAQRLASLVTVSAKDAVSLVSGGLILTAGDAIQGNASANGDAHLIVCGYLKDMP